MPWCPELAISMHRVCTLVGMQMRVPRKTTSCSAFVSNVVVWKHNVYHCWLLSSRLTVRRLILCSVGSFFVPARMVSKLMDSSVPGRKTIRRCRVLTAVQLTLQFELSASHGWWRCRHTPQWCEIFDRRLSTVCDVVTNSHDSCSIHLWHAAL